MLTPCLLGKCLLASYTMWTAMKLRFHSWASFPNAYLLLGTPFQGILFCEQGVLVGVEYENLYEKPPQNRTISNMLNFLWRAKSKLS